jgi:uncharacterized protein (TIGR03118 family)
MTRSARRYPARATLLRSGALVGAVAAAVALAVPASATAKHDMHRHHHDGPAVTRTDLLTNQKDSDLVNAWGMSHGPNTPIWVSDNGADVSTLYTLQPSGIQKAPLVVKIPDGAPTGQVFNDTSAFKVPNTNAAALFIFASENGDLDAWNMQAGTTAVHVGSGPNAVYKGLALVHSPFGPLLLATDFHNNRVDVYDSSFTRLDVPLLFHDPFLPRGYAPFNVAAVGDQVFVTYAKQDANAHDDVAGRGHGFIDVYTTYGAFEHRLVSRGDLNSPWGMVVAPPTFGRLAGTLLVGNFGNGRINAYDMTSGRDEGQLHDRFGRSIVIDGLWGLITGDGVTGGPNTVWFSAGPNDESDGLLGTLTAG